MSKIRRRRPRFEFVQILNAVARDYRVSWRARGLLVELLSYPPDWETTVDDLVKQARRQGGAAEGRDAMRKAARELKDVGYIVETRYQDDRGRWVTELEVTDDPMYDLLAGDSVSAGRTDDGFSGVGEPGVGEPGVKKKTEKKTEKKILPPTPSFEKNPSEADPAGREDETSTNEHTEHLERAQTLVTDAVRRWPRNHPAPSARDAHRLSERVSGELADGGDEGVILHELTRDLQDAGSAVRVILGSRTTTPGWGRASDPRPDHARHEVRTKTPWCGRCDERTRQLVAFSEDGRQERMVRCRHCHPEAAPAPRQDPDVVEDTSEQLHRMDAEWQAKAAQARERKQAELAATKALFAQVRSGAAKEEAARRTR